MRVRAPFHATRRAALAAALLAASLDAKAQEPGPKPGSWAIGAELGGNAARGNSSYSMLATALRFTHLNKRQFELDWASGFTYGQSSETVIARRITTTFKADVHPADTWSPFIFTSIERDRIRRTDLVTNTGVGAKWTYFRNPAGGASFSVAAIHTYKSITQSATLSSRLPAPDEPRRSTARISLRPKFVQKNAAGVSFDQTTYWQPVYNLLDDYSFESTSRIGFATSRIGTVFFQHTYRQDSRPPLGIKRDDQLMVAGIKLQF
jgi:hypothetical protein